MSKSFGILGRQVAETGTRSLISASPPTQNKNHQIPSLTKQPNHATSVDKGPTSLLYTSKRSITIKDVDSFVKNLKSEPLPETTPEQDQLEREEFQKDVEALYTPGDDMDLLQEDTFEEGREYQSDDDSLLKSDPSLLAFREQFPDEYDRFFNRLNQNVISPEELMEEDTTIEDVNSPLDFDVQEVLKSVDQEDPLFHLRNAKMLAESGMLPDARERKIIGEVYSRHALNPDEESDAEWGASDSDYQTVKERRLERRPPEFPEDKPTGTTMFRFNRTVPADEPLPKEMQRRLNQMLGDAQYRKKIDNRFFMNDLEVWYLANRMPVVYSVVKRIFTELRRRTPGFAPLSILDFAAGASAALWAAREVFYHDFSHYTCIERDARLALMGQQLTGDLGVHISYRAKLSTSNSANSFDHNHNKSNKGKGKKEKNTTATGSPHDKNHDIVISAYSLSKQPNAQHRKLLIDTLWNQVSPRGGVLILIESSEEDARGFNMIRQARDYLLDMYPTSEIQEQRHYKVPDQRRIFKSKPRASALLPCAHDKPCPMFAMQKLKQKFYDLRQLARDTKRKIVLPQVPTTVCKFGQRMLRAPMPNQSPLQDIKIPRHLGDAILENFSYVVIRKGDSRVDESRAAETEFRENIIETQRLEKVVESTRSEIHDLEERLADLTRRAKERQQRIKQREIAIAAATERGDDISTIPEIESELDMDMELDDDIQNEFDEFDREFSTNEEVDEDLSGHSDIQQSHELDLLSQYAEGVAYGLVPSEEVAAQLVSTRGTNDIKLTREDDLTAKMLARSMFGAKSVDVEDEIENIQFGEANYDKQSIESILSSIQDPELREHYRGLNLTLEELTRQSPSKINPRKLFVERKFARILTPPLKRGRHVLADICTPQGHIERRIVSKDTIGHSGYKQIRRIRWGDVWPFAKPKTAKELSHERDMISVAQNLRARTGEEAMEKLAEISKLFSPELNTDDTLILSSYMEKGLTQKKMQANALVDDAIATLLAKEQEMEDKKRKKEAETSSNIFAHGMTQENRTTMHEHPTEKTILTQSKDAKNNKNKRATNDKNSNQKNPLEDDSIHLDGDIELDGAALDALSETSQLREKYLRRYLGKSANVFEASPDEVTNVYLEDEDIRSKSQNIVEDFQDADFVKFKQSNPTDSIKNFIDVDVDDSSSVVNRTIKSGRRNPNSRSFSTFTSNNPSILAPLKYSKVSIHSNTTSSISSSPTATPKLVSVVDESIVNGEKKMNKKYVIRDVDGSESTVSMFEVRRATEIVLADRLKAIMTQERYPWLEPILTSDEIDSFYKSFNTLKIRMEARIMKVDAVALEELSHEDRDRAISEFTKSQILEAGEAARKSLALRRAAEANPKLENEIRKKLQQIELAPQYASEKIENLYSGVLKQIEEAAAKHNIPVNNLLINVLSTIPEVQLKMDKIVQIDESLNVIHVDSPRIVASLPHLIRNHPSFVSVSQDEFENLFAQTQDNIRLAIEQKQKPDALLEGRMLELYEVYKTYLDAQIAEDKRISQIQEENYNEAMKYIESIQQQLHAEEESLKNIQNKYSTTEIIRRDLAKRMPGYDLSQPAPNYDISNKPDAAMPDSQTIIFSRESVDPEEMIDFMEADIGTFDYDYKGNVVAIPRNIPMPVDEVPYVPTPSPLNVIREARSIEDLQLDSRRLPENVTNTTASEGKGVGESTSPRFSGVSGNAQAKPSTLSPSHRQETHAKASPDFLASNIVSSHPLHGSTSSDPQLVAKANQAHRADTLRKRIEGSKLDPSSNTTTAVTTEDSTIDSDNDFKTKTSNPSKLKESGPLAELAEISRRKLDMMRAERQFLEHQMNSNESRKSQDIQSDEVRNNTSNVLTQTANATADYQQRVAEMRSRVNSSPSFVDNLFGAGDDGQNVAIELSEETRRLQESLPSVTDVAEQAAKLTIKFDINRQVDLEKEKISWKELLPDHEIKDDEIEYIRNLVEKNLKKTMKEEDVTSSIVEIATAAKVEELRHARFEWAKRTFENEHGIMDNEARVSDEQRRDLNKKHGYDTRIADAVRDFVNRDKASLRAKMMDLQKIQQKVGEDGETYENRPILRPDEDTTLYDVYLKRLERANEMNAEIDQANSHTNANTPSLIFNGGISMRGMLQNAVLQSRFERYRKEKSAREELSRLLNQDPDIPKLLDGTYDYTAIKDKPFDIQVKLSKLKQVRMLMEIVDPSNKSDKQKALDELEDKYLAGEVDLDGRKRVDLSEYGTVDSTNINRLSKRRARSELTEEQMLYNIFEDESNPITPGSIKMKLEDKYLEVLGDSMRFETTDGPNTSKGGVGPKEMDYTAVSERMRLLEGQRKAEQRQKRAAFRDRIEVGKAKMLQDRGIDYIPSKLASELKTRANALHDEYSTTNDNNNNSSIRDFSKKLSLNRRETLERDLKRLQIRNDDHEQDKKTANQRAGIAFDEAMAEIDAPDRAPQSDQEILHENPRMKKIEKLNQSITEKLFADPEFMKLPMHIRNRVIDEAIEKRDDKLRKYREERKTGLDYLDRLRENDEPVKDLSSELPDTVQRREGVHQRFRDEYHKDLLRQQEEGADVDIEYELSRMDLSVKDFDIDASIMDPRITDRYEIARNRARIETFKNYDAQKSLLNQRRDDAGLDSKGQLSETTLKLREKRLMEAERKIKQDEFQLTQRVLTNDPMMSRHDTLDVDEKGNIPARLSEGLPTTFQEIEDVMRRKTEVRNQRRNGLARSYELAAPFEPIHVPTSQDIWTSKHKETRMDVIENEMSTYLYQQRDHDITQAKLSEDSMLARLAVMHKAPIETSKSKNVTNALSFKADDLSPANTVDMDNITSEDIKRAADFERFIKGTAEVMDHREDVSLERKSSKKERQLKRQLSLFEEIAQRQRDAANGVSQDSQKPLFVANTPNAGIRSASIISEVPVTPKARKMNKHRK